MRHLFNFLFLCFCVSGCNFHQKAGFPISETGNNVIWNDSLSIEDNIAVQAVPFQNDSTFPFLDELAKTRSVILIGEGGHGDSITIVIKSKMQHYLSLKGFSMAYEGYPFLTSYAFSNPKYNALTDKWRDEKLQEDEAVQLFNALRAENINRIWGIDVNAGYYDIDCAKAILSEYLGDNTFIIDWEIMDWEKLKDYYKRKFINLRDISVSEQVEMMRMIDVISNYTQYLIHKIGKTNDLAAILQWIRNVNTNFSVVNIWRDKIDIYDYSNTPLTTLPFRNRDAQMAENILWITEHFPEEKFMVWLANYHGAKDISQTMLPQDTLMYFIHQCTAEAVYNKLGDKLYSLAFTSLNKNRNVEKGLLESAIAKQTNDAPYAFVDFESLRFADGFRDKEFDAAMINKKRGKWLYIFDGIYYIKNEKVYEWYEH